MKLSGSGIVGSVARPINHSQTDHERRNQSVPAANKPPKPSWRRSPNRPRHRAATRLRSKSEQKHSENQQQDEALCAISMTIDAVNVEFRPRSTASPPAGAPRLPT